MWRWHLAAEPHRVEAAVRRLLSAQGWCVQCSFDLRAVLERLPRWRCPHHGEASCPCSYVVLFAHKPGWPVISIHIEGRDAWTCVNISGDLDQNTTLYRALEEAVLGEVLSASGEPLEEETFVERDK